MRRLIDRFRRDAQGSVALVAGLSAIPLVLVAGVALDMERAYHDRAGLQAAVDGAALALGASDLSDLDGLTTAQIATRMTGQEDESPSESQVPLGRAGDAREVGALIAWLASDQASYVTGASYVVDGGLLLIAGEHQ